MSLASSFWAAMSRTINSFHIFTFHFVMCFVGFNVSRKAHRRWDHKVREIAASQRPAITSTPGVEVVVARFSHAFKVGHGARERTGREEVENAQKMLQ